MNDTPHYIKTTWHCSICYKDLEAEPDGCKMPVCKNCYEEEKEAERHAEESKHYAEQ